MYIRRIYTYLKFKQSGRSCTIQNHVSRLRLLSQKFHTNCKVKTPLVSHLWLAVFKRFNHGATCFHGDAKTSICMLQVYVCYRYYIHVTSICLLQVYACYKYACPCYMYLCSPVAAFLLDLESLKPQSL